MSAALQIVIGLAGGGVLGFAYFAALWWTVRRLPGARNPAVLLLGSYAARIGLVAAGLFLIGTHDWRRLGGCLAGFLAARIMATRRFAATPAGLAEKENA